MAVVVDASSLLKAADPGAEPRNQDRLQRLEASHEFLAPVLLGYELVQFFHVKSARRPPAEQHAHVQHLLSTVRLVPTDWRRLAQVAEATGLSAYDAAYLEAAVRLRATLLTEDAKLAAAGAQILGKGKVARLG